MSHTFTSLRQVTLWLRARWVVVVFRVFGLTSSLRGSCAAFCGHPVLPVTQPLVLVVPQVEPSPQLYGEMAFTLLRLGDCQKAVTVAEQALELAGTQASLRMKQVRRWCCAHVARCSARQQVER